MVVAPVDPIEDGQPPHGLAGPESELSPGWGDAAPGPPETQKVEEIKEAIYYY